MVFEFAAVAWLVSYSFSKLADPLIQHAIDRCKNIKNFGKNINKLAGLLDKISAAIQYAEERQLDDSKLQAWVWRLREAVFSAEDVLDRIRSGAPREAKGKEIKDLITSEDASTLSKAIKKLENVVADMNSFLLLVGGLHDMQKVVPDEPPEWRVTTALDKQHELLGRESEKQRLAEFLLSHGQGKENFSCISIVGMGGIGKTALARRAYNDSKPEDFDVKAWVCVSHRASNKRILIDTINDASKETLPDHHNKPMSRIKRILADLLKGRRFLIVLDDVWDSSRYILDEFDMLFREAREGSKLIVTTRDSSIGKEMSSTTPIHLHDIELKYYLRLFQKHSFGKNKKDPQLKAICEGIATRLYGLPLAAETYGRALRPKLTENHWKGISKKKMHQMGAGKRDIMPTLRLSYEQMSGDLKECFVSCSLFPKDHVFTEMGIIRVWMALGFLGAADAGEQMLKGLFARDGAERMEDRGERIFAQLVERSFFRKTNEEPRTQTYLIPGPLHELADLLSSGEYFRIERSRSDEEPVDIPQRARHVYLDVNDLARASKELLQIANLRSLWIAGKISSSPKRLEFQDKLEELLKVTTHLRVLRVSEILRANVSLAKLKQLRYLWIHAEDKYKNSVLQNSICQLYQLQTQFISRSCSYDLLMSEDSKSLVSRWQLDTELESVCQDGVCERSSPQKLASFEENTGLKRELEAPEPSSSKRSTRRKIF